MPERSSGAPQSLEHPGAWSILPGRARGRAQRAASGSAGPGRAKGPGPARARPGRGVARGRGGGGAMAVAEAAEATVPCRVQYLEDADPFAFGSFPEPRRAPVYALEEALALGAQLPALHRLVGAPLPVSGDGDGGESPVRAPCGGNCWLEGTGGRRGIGRRVPDSAPGVSLREMPASAAPRESAGGRGCAAQSGRNPGRGKRDEARVHPRVVGLRQAACPAPASHFHAGSRERSAPLRRGHLQCCFLLRRLELGEVMVGADGPQPLIPAVRQQLCDRRAGRKCMLSNFLQLAGRQEAGCEARHPCLVCVSSSLARAGKWGEKGRQGTLPVYLLWA